MNIIFKSIQENHKINCSFRADLCYNVIDSRSPLDQTETLSESHRLSKKQLLPTHVSFLFSYTFNAENLKKITKNFDNFWRVGFELDEVKQLGQKSILTQSQTKRSPRLGRQSPRLPGRRAVCALLPCCVSSVGHCSWPMFILTPS